MMTEITDMDKASKKNRFRHTNTGENSRRPFVCQWTNPALFKNRRNCWGNGRRAD